MIFLDTKFIVQFEEYQQLINNELGNLIKKKHKTPIYNAMGYSLLAGGKRIRPILLLSACVSCGGNIKSALAFACSLEMIHTYSLIHDDLPAMDNDDYRRGMLTNHKVFGEAISILAGDGLLNLAYELMIEHCINNNNLNDIEAFKNIATASGVNGMIGGQVMDILSENKTIDRDSLIYIHKNKTGALISAALTAGALLANANNEIVGKYKEAGDLLGFAFQIKDDLLDVTGTREALGKDANSDISNNKSTYVSLLGIDKANEDYIAYSNKAISIFEELNSPFLKQLALNLIRREN
jgi:geranylgeranyl diphosphate synthase, type II